MGTLPGFPTKARQACAQTLVKDFTEGLDWGGGDEGRATLPRKPMPMTSNSKRRT